MKTTLVIVFAVISVAVCEKYTDRYDQINVEEVLENEQLSEAYYKCITDKGRCTAEGKELKAHLKEAIETECAKCTETQKKKAEIVIKYLIKNRHDHWLEVCKKYDTSGTKCPKYEKKLKV